MKKFFDGMFGIIRRAFYFGAFFYAAAGVYLIGEKAYDQYRYMILPATVILETVQNRHLPKEDLKIQNGEYGIIMKVRVPKGTPDNLILKELDRISFSNIPWSVPENFIPTSRAKWLDIVIMLLGPLWAWIIHQLVIWICWGQKPYVPKLTILAKKSESKQIEPTITN